MKDLQSYAEVVKGLLGAILMDCSRAYPHLAKEFSRDYLRLDSAIDCHGIQFALITMPTVGKAFDQCLANGRLVPFRAVNFGVEKDGITPRLFRGLFKRVFDRQGVLERDPDIQAIAFIRQLLGVAKKLRISCDDIDNRKAVESFIRTDSSITPSNHDWSEEWSDETMVEISKQSFTGLPASTPLPLFRQAGIESSTERFSYANRELLRKVQLVADIFSSLLGVYDPSQWKFRQGPGAVSDQAFGSYKYEFKAWPERLETVFPYSEFAIANYACRDDSSYIDQCSDREIPAVLIAVPKTLDKPRLIAKEVTSLQWCQQSIRTFFYRRTQETLLGRFVDYTDQTKSGDLALSASIDGRLSTVDLSEASDRISLPVVERLFRHNASLLRALRATRSVYLEQNIHPNAPKLMKLRKFSTMGNACTFPVQSTLFTVCAIACTLHANGQKVSIRSIESLRDQVRVFGDDIIIPTHAVEYLLALLPALGLKVNPDKTFVNGLFRESCGIDAYAGVNVAPARVLDVPEQARPGSIVSTVDVSNNLLRKGYECAALFLRKRVPSMIQRKIMEVEHGSGVFGFQVYGPPDNRHLRSRWSERYSRREWQCLVPKVKTQTLEPNSNAGLLQFFTESAQVVTNAISSLGYKPSRPKTKLGLGWVPGY